MNTSQPGRPAAHPQPTVSPLAAPVASPVEQLTYFQLSRQMHGWWRPLVTVGIFLAVSIVLFIGLLVVAMFIPGFDFFAAGVDMANPVHAALAAGMLALFVPASIIAARLSGRRGTIHSVAGRLRWGLLGSSMALATIPVLISVAAAWTFDPVAPTVSATTLGLVAVALLIIPLQAAGEEYLFRGILMQAVGHWLRAPIWGLLISLPLFVLGHNYDAWGLAFTGVFAAVATWLTWRTGGLEAAIALHVVNNSVAFVLGAFGLADLNATEIGWTDGFVAAAIPLGFALLFAWWWKRIDGDARYARTAPAWVTPAPVSSATGPASTEIASVPASPFRS